MSLRLFLLGQFKIQADDLPIELPSRPAQSLLAFLSLNAGVTHRREKLASLMWPEATESNARSYLRQALWRMRKSLESGGLEGDDYLQISDISVTFNDQSSYWLDAALLLEAAESRPVDDIIQIVRLYRGELLPGFYEEWVILERDRLEAAYHHKMNLLLERLIQAGQWQEALEWGEHWIRLGHSPEAAYRSLMHAHAGLGDQAMVSATYQRCVEALERELGVEPSPETLRLYEQALQGELGARLSLPPTSRDSAGQQPPFLEEGEQPPVEKPIFVARERELAQLDRFLGLAMAGHGRVAFVTGEAGSGKTTLIQEFAQRAQEAHPDLIVASGNCNAHTGLGDPYLPFREILGLLTGDVEARWAAGAISTEHARRLWNTLPVTAQALIENGPDLIDTFVLRTALLQRAKTYAPGRADWLSRLERLVERKSSGPGLSSTVQSDLFEQYTRVLKALTRQSTLVIAVDDLQWADQGSISLLFHLGRQLAGSRIMIVGAYRPEEVAIGRDGGRHPLDPVVNEFQRQYGDIIVNLGLAENQDFVAAFLDSEPNRLRLTFREMLYRQTHGHPLFTIELLRGLQERGDLVKDPEGRWVEGPVLGWETLPARVEAAIAERIARLAEPLQAALRVASVEGETFTAEMVARVLASDEREMLGRLSNELDRRHRLVRAQSIQRVNGQLLSRYRFRHILYQKYLYSSLDEVERVHLHEQVGTALEELYGAQESAALEDIAPQLARHFQKARIVEKAVHYLHQAGERAVGLSAYQEGIAHLTTGLAQLERLPDSPKRAQKELALQMALAMAWQGAWGAQAQEIKMAYTRARELCQGKEKTSELFRVMSGLSIFHYVRAGIQRAHELAEEALDLARRTNDPVIEALGNWNLGFILFCIGDYTTARTHLNQVIDSYKPQQHHQPFVFLRGSDAGVGALAYDACCLWCLGYPEQASQRSQEALTLARELDHPFTLADVLCYAGGMFHAISRDAKALERHAEALVNLSQEKNLEGWLGIGISHRGEALAMRGDIQEGIAQMRQGMATMNAEHVRLNLPGILGFLGEAQGKAGRPGEGLATVKEALKLVEKTGERHWEAELHRLKAELLLMQSEEGGAEASLHKALQAARQQRAKSWELRAATDLARLWRNQGRMDEAHTLLNKVYDWFTEGFDTPNLIAARALLKELS